MIDLRTQEEVESGKQEYYPNKKSGLTVPRLQGLEETFRGSIVIRVVFPGHAATEFTALKSPDVFAVMLFLDFSRVLIEL